MSRLAELEARRQMLRLRSAQLREEFAADERALQESLGGFDRATAIARGLASPPALIAGGALLLTFFRPARAFAWVTRGLVFVSLARRVLSLAKAFRPRTPAPPE